MSQEITVCGFHAIQSIIDWEPQRIVEVFVDQDRRDKRMSAIIDMLEKHSINVARTDKQHLDKLGKHSVHQGIVASVLAASILHEQELMSAMDKTPDNGLYLLLDQIKDPHNFGACLRTADAAGIDGVIISKDNTVGFTPTVMKTSSGAIDFVPVFQVTNLSRTLKKLKQKGAWVVGTSDKAEQSLYDANLNGLIIIAMGSEQNGLRRLTENACDFLVNIPMLGHVHSLNVSVATGVVLYEALRQRQLN